MTSPAKRWLDVVLAIGVGAGVLARIVRYWDARSLWSDEAQLALNIWGRDSLALLAPLDFGQSAPWGFLLLERAAVVAFGPGELVLRAVPLLASLASIAVFAHLARSVLDDRAARIALLLFATCEPLIFYASEVKQYSLDVLVTLSLLAIVLHTARSPLTRSRAVQLALAGALALWLSNPAVFVCAAGGIALAVAEWRAGRRDAWPGLAAIAAVWLASFAALYALQIRPALEHPYLREFWAGAYAPMPPHGSEDWAWYPRTLIGFFADPVALPPQWLALVVAGLGAWRLGRSRPLVLWCWVGPLALGLLASMAELYPLRTHPPVDLRERLYPFVGRLWLFAVPAVLALIAAGVDALAALAGSWGERREAGGRSPRGDAVAALMLLAVAGLSLRQLAINAWDPPSVQEFRPVAEQLGEQVLAGDVVWVQVGSEPTFEYYARLLQLPVSARNVGLSGPEETAAFERELAALRPGARVWLVAVDHPAWRKGDERRALELRLRSVGQEGRRLSAHRASALEFVVPGDPP